MNLSLLRVLRRSPVLALVAGALLAACKGEQGGATPTTGQPSIAAGGSATAQGGSAQGGTQGMGGTPGMSGMQGMNGMTGGMMAKMQTHMRVMQGAGADSMKAMLPMHRQMVANMLAQMTGEMRDMHVPADARWTATVDSLRQDLVHMPEMSGAELKAMMPAHMGRVTRLVEMHRSMVGGAGQSGTGATPARPSA